MDAKIRRLLKAKQGKVDIGSGIPGANDGYEGQVEVRDTSDGPMLFAKLKGKWIKTPFSSGGDFFIPKAWTTDIVTPSATTGAIAIVPGFIPLDNIISLSVMLKYDPGSTNTFLTQMPGTSNIQGANVDWWLSARKIKREVFLSFCGLVFQGKNGKLTILYK